MSASEPWTSPEVAAHLRQFFERDFMRARDEFAGTIPARQADAAKRGMPIPTSQSLLPLERSTAARVAFPALAEEIRRLVQEDKIPKTDGGREFTLGLVGAFGDEIPRDTDEPLRAAHRAVADLRILFAEAALPTVGREAADPGIVKEQRKMATDPRRVAVVHGRNHKARDGMFDFLRALDLDPVAWDDAIYTIGKGAPHSREILDALFETTQAVVVLLTADEDAVLIEGLRRDSGDGGVQHQARPNVWIEAGMALGVNRDRTILVRFGNHDQPSDIDGLDYIDFDGSSASRQRLKTRLEMVQCGVVVRSGDWLKAGESNFAGALEKTESSARVTEGPAPTQLVFEEPFYFAPSDGTPLCPRCWEASKQRLHLDEDWDRRRWECPDCHYVKVLKKSLPPRQ